jgi:membrane protease YdiL (CAAX protease family)
MTMTQLTKVPAPGRAARRLRGGVGVFLAVAFGISWLAWGTALVLPGTTDDPVVMALFLLGGCGPSLAALLLWARGHRGPRLVVGRRAPVWASAALVLGFLPALAAAFGPLLVGASAVGASEVSAALAAGGGLLAFIGTTLLMGPLSEELGWRGHAQPRLRRRLSPTATTVVLGAVWGSWHLPLFFLPGTWQHSVGLASPEGVLILVGAVPLSALAWFVSERLRGGVAAAVILHASSNASLALFPPSATGAALVFVGVLLALAVLVLVVGRGRARGKDVRA